MKFLENEEQNKNFNSLKKEIEEDIKKQRYQNCPIPCALRGTLKHREDQERQPREEIRRVDQESRSMETSVVP